MISYGLREDVLYACFAGMNLVSEMEVMIVKITKDIKVLRILVDKTMIGLDGITDINPPDDQVPYWTISYDTGHRVWTTGSVTLEFRRI